MCSNTKLLKFVLDKLLYVMTVPKTFKHNGDLINIIPINGVLFQQDRAGLCYRSFSSNNLKESKLSRDEKALRPKLYGKGVILKRYEDVLTDLENVVDSEQLALALSKKVFTSLLPQVPFLAGEVEDLWMLLSTVEEIWKKPGRIGSSCERLLLLPL